MLASQIEELENNRKQAQDTRKRLSLKKKKQPIPDSPIFDPFKFKAINLKKMDNFEVEIIRKPSSKSNFIYKKINFFLINHNLDIESKVEKDIKDFNQFFKMG